MTLLHPLMIGLSWMDPNWLLQHFGSEFFMVCLLIIFVECGLFFPILPGDTLLFSVGIFISGQNAAHLPNLFLALLAFIVAAVLGNLVGYEIGRAVGAPLAERDGRILKKRYFTETSVFFEKHGPAALIVGRFVPFVRTYVTVVAGIARMDRHKFWTWSGVGAAAWVLIVTLLGYFLGSTFPSLANNVDKAIIVMLLLSVVPIGWEWQRKRRAKRARI